MSRVLLVGDLHLRDRPPRNRNEGYLEEVLELLDYTAQLERDLDLDAVIWAGDVFDHKQPARTSHRTVLKAIEAVKKYRNLWIVVGNHDITNDVLDTAYEQQPIGVLLEAGAHELKNWHPFLPVVGIPWQQRWTAPGAVPAAFDWIVDDELEKNFLVVTHAPIYPPALASSQFFELLDTKEIASSLQHRGSVFYGHIHDFHGVYEVDGTQFCNPGAISRGSLTESNVSRQVQCAIWDSETNEFELVELPAKPAAEIFKLEQAETKKNLKLDLDQFLAGVGSTTLTISSTTSVISHIQQLELDPTVKNVAIELLELAD